MHNFAGTVLDQHKANQVYSEIRRLLRDLPKHKVQEGTFQRHGSQWTVRYWGWKIEKGERIWAKMPRHSLGYCVVGPHGEKPLTEAQAIAAKKRFMLVVNANTAGPESSLSFRQYLEGEYSSHLISTSAQHQANAEICYRLHILPAIGDIPLNELKRKDIQALINWKVREGKSRETRAKIRTHIAGVLNYARDQGVLTGRLATDKINLGDPELERKMYALSFAQAQQMLRDPVLQQPLLTMVALEICCSPNIGELQGIRQKCVNLGDEEIIVDGLAVPPKSVLINRNWKRERRLGATKNHYRVRSVPIPDGLMPLFYEWRQMNPFRGADDFFFASESGQPIDGHNANNREFDAINQALTPRMKTLCWTVLRHTFATRAEDIGIRDIDKVALAGWTRKRGTMAFIYTHEEYDRMRRIVNQLAEGYDLPRIIEERCRIAAKKVVSINA